MGPRPSVLKMEVGFETMHAINLHACCKRARYSKKHAIGIRRQSDKRQICVVTASA